VADPTYSRASITVEAAESMLDAAVAAGTELGKTFCVAVVDESGVLKAFRRMDGAVMVSVQTSQDKAYSAVVAARPTHVWEEIFKQFPIMGVGAPTGIDRLLVLGGGYPIIVDGQIVGGIGVGGGTFADDMQVAEAGLKAVGAAV
jgi:uncharacterized protein GlcG (DUF336 family)